MSMGILSIADLAFNRRIAETIKNYWVSRGYAAPEIEVVELGFNKIMRANFHGLRSDMVNGFPKGHGHGK
jgi:hypothetical protein